MTGVLGSSGAAVLQVGSNSAETSRAALPQTSHVSTAAAALKLDCFTHKSAPEQDILALVQFP